MHLLDRPLRRLAGSRLVAAATWPHGIDRYAGLVAPAWALDEVRATVVAVRHQTADTVTLTLRPNGNWRGHTAGQHVVVGVEVDGVRQQRCFSVASSGHDPTTVELTCKVGPTSVVARHLRDHTGPGDLIHLSPAQGDFVLPADRPAALLLVSAGSGITPVLSMLRTLDAEGHDGEVAFLHYARSGDDFLYANELAAIARRHPGVRVTVVTEHDATGDVAGRFVPAHLAVAGLDPTVAEAFVCGPAPFMDAVEAAWTAACGTGERFHTERFAPPTPPTPAVAGGGANTGGAIRFSLSGREAANDGRSLLEQAEAAGLTPTHGCRMGICHTCITPLTTGCVTDAVTGEVTEGDGSPVRICVSVPTGDVEIDL